MTISRIDHLEPVQPNKRPGRNVPVGGIDRTDTIHLTPEAREKAEMYQVMEIVKSAPELDDVRIAELRQKIDDPAYLNERVVNATAEKIIGSWFS